MTPKKHPNKNQPLDWQADEEDGWEEVVPHPAGIPPSLPRLKWWMWLTVFLVAGITLSIAVRRIQHQVKVATHQVEADVQATHALLLRGILENNEDFFVPQLSQSDIEWWRAERELFTLGEVLDRAQWGLPLADSPLTVQHILLSADLQQAQVEFVLSYSTAQADTFELLHTFTYRQEDGRWLLSRPDDAFWGGWITNEDAQLTLIYPTRDQLIGDRLASDLRQTLSQVCAIIECTIRSKIQLRLERYIGVLGQTGQNNSAGFLGHTTISLPAPTVWGIPVDEKGYQMLLQAYAIEFVAYLLRQQHGGSPSAASQPLVEAAIQRTLVDVGLLTWPPANNGLNQTLPPTISGRDVYLLCSPSINGPMNLYRFNLATQRSELVVSDHDWIDMVPIAQDNGLFLYERDNRFNRVYYYRPGQAPLLLPGANDVLSVYDWPSTRPVLGYPGDNSYSFGLFDPTTCNPAGCQITPLPEQIPQLSPDGTHLLLYHVTNNQIFLSDPAGQNQTLIASGYQPFWIDNHTVGLFQFEGRKSFDAPSQLLLTDVESGQTRVIVDKNDLIRIGLEDDLPLQTTFLLSGATVSPANPNLLLITVVFFQDQNMSAPIFQRVIYRYWRDSGQLEMLKWFDDGEPFFSPNRQWLIVNHQQSGQGVVELYSLNNIEQAALSYPFFNPFAPQLDWLPGEEWLLFLSNGFLTLARPAGNEQYQLPAPAGCAAALWAR